MRNLHQICGQLNALEAKKSQKKKTMLNAYKTLSSRRKERKRGKMGKRSEMPQRKAEIKTKMQQRNSDESVACIFSLFLSPLSFRLTVCVCVCVWRGDAMLRVVRVQKNICISSHRMHICTYVRICTQLHM